MQSAEAAAQLREIRKRADEARGRLRENAEGIAQAARLAYDYADGTDSAGGKNAEVNIASALHEATDFLDAVDRQLKMATHYLSLALGAAREVDARRAERARNLIGG